MKSAIYYAVLAPPLLARFFPVFHPSSSGGNAMWKSRFSHKEQWENGFARGVNSLNGAFGRVPATHKLGKANGKACVGRERKETPELVSQWWRTFVTEERELCVRRR